jgi:hypothetical protein
MIGMSVWSIAIIDDSFGIRSSDVNIFLSNV